MRLGSSSHLILNLRVVFFELEQEDQVTFELEQEDDASDSDSKMEQEEQVTFEQEEQVTFELELVLEQEDASKMRASSEQH